MNLPIGIQLFGVRDHMDKDVEGTLRAISEMGYDGIEICSGSYGMEPEVFRALCDSLSLRIISAHLSYEALCTDMEKELDLYQTLGVSYIAYPYMLDENRPGTPRYPEVVANMKKFAAAARERGIQMMYHNHAFEFEKIDGQYKLDYQYDQLSCEDLQAELDTAWVKLSGEDPAAYLRKYAGRCPCVHLKDYHIESEVPMETLPKEGEDAPEHTMEFRPLGRGMQNIPAILEAALDAGSKWIIMEQDNPSMGLDPLDAAKISREYLRSLGW